MDREQALRGFGRRASTRADRGAAERLPVVGKRTLSETLPEASASVPRQVGAGTMPVRPPAPERTIPELFGGAVQFKLQVGAAPGARGVVPTPSGGGQAIPEVLRTRLERALGASFATVRVHEDPRVSTLGARALATGEHVLFAPGEYRPESCEGQRLLAHELAHVVQQRAGRAGGAGVMADPGLEAEAEAAADRAVGGDAGGARDAAHATHAPAPGGVAQPKLIDGFGREVTSRRRDLEADQVLYDSNDFFGPGVELRFVSANNGNVVVTRDGVRWTYNTRNETYAREDEDRDRENRGGRGGRGRRGRGRPAQQRQSKRKHSEPKVPLPKRQKLHNDERDSAIDDERDSAIDDERDERHAGMDVADASSSESEDSDFEWEDGVRGVRVDMLDRLAQYTPMRKRQTEIAARNQRTMTPAVRLRRELAIFEQYLRDKLDYLRTVPQDEHAEAEAERLRTELARIAATRAHHDALDDAEVENYNADRLDGEALDGQPPNIFVPQARGNHYFRSMFSGPQRRAHRDRLDVGEAHVSSAAYELLNEELAKEGLDKLVPGDTRADVGNPLHARLIAIARRVRDRINALKGRTNEASELDRGVASLAAQNHVPWDSLYEVHQTAYSNGYAEYHAATAAAARDQPVEDQGLCATLAALFESADDPKWTANPMVSTGDEFGHPPRYSLGDKPPSGEDPKTGVSYKEDRLRPLYGDRPEPHPRRPYSGKTDVALHPLEEMEGVNAPSHVLGMQADVRTDVGFRIFSESESSFPGLVEPDRVICQQIAKYPSFAGPYDPKVALKYGLDKAQWTKYQALFSSVRRRGDEQGKQGKRKLAKDLAAHFDRRAREEAMLAAARMGGIVRSRDLDGGFGTNVAKRDPVAFQRDITAVLLGLSAALTLESAALAPREDSESESESDDEGWDWNQYLRDNLGGMAERLERSEEELRERLTQATRDEVRRYAHELFQPRARVEPPAPGEDVMPDGVLDEYLAQHRGEMAAGSRAFYPFRDYTIPDPADGAHHTKGPEVHGERAPSSHGLVRDAVRHFGSEVRAEANRLFYQDKRVISAPQIQQEIWARFCALFYPLIRDASRELEQLGERVVEAAPDAYQHVVAQLPVLLDRATLIEDQLAIPREYRVERVDGDGNCLFEAVARCLDGKVVAATLRTEAAAEVEHNPGEYHWAVPGRLASEIADFIRIPRQWNRAEGDAAPLALARARGITLVVHSSLYEVPQRINDGHNEIHVLYSGSHYDALIRNG